MRAHEWGSLGTTLTPYEELVSLQRVGQNQSMDHLEIYPCLFAKHAVDVLALLLLSMPAKEPQKQRACLLIRSDFYIHFGVPTGQLIYDDPGGGVLPRPHSTDLIGKPQFYYLVLELMPL